MKRILYLLFVLLFSCGTHVRNGIVIDKIIKPPHTETIFLYDPSTKTQMPSYIQYPEQKLILLNGWFGSREYTTHWVEVSDSIYDHSKIGDIINL